MSIKLLLVSENQLISHKEISGKVITVSLIGCGYFLLRSQDIRVLVRKYCLSGCEEGPGICALIMTLGSLFLIVVSLPLSLLFVVKVVQEYERAVIFRLGRLLTGGARGPGVFFIIPCVDIYEKIDMRSQTFEIPPQEVGHGH